MALGYPHPDFLLPLLTARQYREWRVYFELEPWGPVGEDYQHSYTRETLAGVMGAKKRNGKAPSVHNMSLYRLTEESRRERRLRRRSKGKAAASTKPQQSVEEMKQILQGIAAMQNKQSRGVQTRQNKPMKRRR